MHLLIVYHKKIPVTAYGGIQRVIWYLAKELVAMGHKVTFLVEAGSSCDFASVKFIQANQSIVSQIPDDVDLVQFNFHLPPSELSQMKKPYVVNIQGNLKGDVLFDKNTIFVSQNHAARHQAEAYVYNGMDWDDYMQPDFSKKDKYVHFLGKAAWRLKNLKGCVQIAKKTTNYHLKVLGGTRLNFNMGFRLTLTPKVKFYGMVGGAEKFNLLNNSSGLLFPVRWHEPFGIAITESLFYGCPVFGTPYGSLPELVHKEVGFLSSKVSEHVAAIKSIDQYKPSVCHEYARDVHNSRKMALDYLTKYEKVLNGNSLNTTAPKVYEQKDKFLPWEK